MDNVGGVECFESTQALVSEVLCVVVRQVLRPNHPVHVCFHELLDYCVEISAKSKSRVTARTVDLLEGIY
jgi:hypothetical protein